MLLTPHILAALAIVTKVQNPILGLFLAFLSHYLLDVFPQKEYSIANIRNRSWSKSLPDFLKVFSDILVGLIIVFLLGGFRPLFLVAIFLALVPDGFTLLHCIFPANKLLKKHLKMHTAINAIGENKKIPAFWGIASQIAVVIVTIFLLR